MSIIICTRCERRVDTDKEETDIINGREVCEDCSNEAAEE